jgi:anaerobic magnesium-protoporphyrin IX monomethyl ester cyclase
MNILFLNIPNSEQITRRYMCSYSSPESLLPPLELISLAAIAKKENHKVLLIDSIAEKLSYKESFLKISEFKPEMIVSMTGFECFQDDINYIKELKDNFPNVNMILFGYYATKFSLETLKFSNANYIILGEPDFIFNEIIIKLGSGKPIDEINGICFLNEMKLIKVGDEKRISNISNLPMPAYELLKSDSYYEPLLKRPFGMIQSMRGCPYQCNYCVKSFGSKTVMLTSIEIIEHVKRLKELFNIKSLRFIDDTFTVNKQRVIEICQLLVKEKLTLEWTCLSRADNLSQEMLYWMRKSGCVRIYIGVETGSQRMLDLYNKGINRNDSINKIKLCRKMGIESAAFFMLGHPSESENDINACVDFAIESKINFISISPLTPYPGTQLFESLNDQINFRIYPYLNEWKDNEINTRYLENSKLLYKKFYFRFGFVTNNLGSISKFPVRFLTLSLKNTLDWFTSKNFFISGIKPKVKK